MTEIAFTILGEPTAKGRPRFFKQGDFVRTYTPKETVLAEQNFRSQAIAYAPVNPLAGEITLIIRVYRKIPASFSGKKQGLADAGELRPITRPDFDNYAKLICDSMNTVFWHDDSQVVSCLVEKYYSVRPRVEVKLSERAELTPK